MRPNQRKQFYAQKFHSRLGPLTSAQTHVRVPKEIAAQRTPSSVGNPFRRTLPQDGFVPTPAPQRESRRPPIAWEEEEEDEPLSAATFRARALERALRGDEPQNSLAPQRLFTTPTPRAPVQANRTTGSQRQTNPPASAQRIPQQPQPAQPRAAQRSVQFQAPQKVIHQAPAPVPVQVPAQITGPLEVVNAELTALDVMIGNSVITTQPKQNVLPKAAYLVSDTDSADLYSKDTVMFSAQHPVCCVELVLEIGGPLGRFDQYDSDRSVSVSFFAGAHSILAPCKCLADYLMHGKLESYEFGEEELHLFRMPLGFAEGQGIVLRDRAKLRVVLEGELTRLKAMGERHRFFVRYFEEK